MHVLMSEAARICKIQPKLMHVLIPQYKWFRMAQDQLVGTSCLLQDVPSWAC